MRSDAAGRQNGDGDDNNRIGSALNVDPAKELPSFSCREAKQADEAVICQSQKLAALNSKLAEIFRKAQHSANESNRRSLEATQRSWLRARFQCGMDSSCIEKLYNRRIQELRESATTEAPRKISVGEHAGDATILQLQGTDTDHAGVWFRRELDDLVEDCSRNTGSDANGIVDLQKVADCVKTASRRENGRVYKRSGRCPIATFYTEFGNYTMINAEKEKESIKTANPINQCVQTGKIIGRSKSLEIVAAATLLSFSIRSKCYAPYRTGHVLKATIPIRRERKGGIGCSF